MRVAILGAGVAGATLYDLLKKGKDVYVDIYGRKSSNMCGIKSCAWGVNTYKFEEICGVMGLHYYRYCLGEVHRYRVFGLAKRCCVTVINKPLLLGDLTGNNVIYSAPRLDEYDRVIDATGQSNGAKHATYQIKVETNQTLEVVIGLFPKLYCKWVFPLAHNVAHVGVLSFDSDLGGMDKKLSGYNPMCECYSSIHTGGLDRELIKGNVWKVGESAGIVDPITGSGILPAMISSMILYENWDEPEQYKKAIIARFGYMDSRLKVLFRNEFSGVPIV